MTAISYGTTSAARQLLNEVISLLDRHPQEAIDQQTVENVEQTAHRAVCLLRQRFNETNPTPFNRMPPELLRLVFELLRQPCSACSGPQGLLISDSASSYRPLTAPMLVSHKWYRVIRQHAALWTDIVLELTARHGIRPRWDVHLLEWSKEAPINLRLEFTAGQVAQCESVLQQHGDRIRRLQLFTVCVASVHEMPRLLSTLVDPSRLTRLSLSLPNPMDMGTPHIRADPGPMLCLRELVLDRVMWVPAHPLPALIAIRMMGIQPLLYEQLSALLSLAPSLDALHLAATMVDPSRPPATSPLPLSHLRTLTLTHMLASDVQKLMTWQLLPAVEDMRIHKLTLDISPGRPFLLRPLTLSCEPMLRLDVFAPGPRYTDRGKHLSFAAQSDRSTFSLDAMSRGESSWGDAAFWLLAVPTVLHLHSLTSCRLRLSSWMQSTLYGFARHVPNLQHIVVQSVDAPEAATVVGTVPMVHALSKLLQKDDPVLSIFLGLSQPLL
ncbi:hypothetical protein K466DRAFT_665330 [Polyporus arcularius HHB13444]|uniref:F-box domain-containing protein n=1 Tax=Polyporus arcularius HHB13444 TaxID=1314778 RepID=A0A5C3P579_9APHY|nr:hypothetical protein K466DRAFT_665330 [Polyporus arcularius HHB13444]